MFNTAVYFDVLGVFLSDVRWWAGRCSRRGWVGGVVRSMSYCAKVICGCFGMSGDLLSSAQGFGASEAGKTANRGLCLGDWWSGDARNRSVCLLWGAVDDVAGPCEVMLF